MEESDLIEPEYIPSDDVPEVSPDSDEPLPQIVPESVASSSRPHSKPDVAPVLDIWPEYANPSYRMPDEIEVKVTLNSGEYFFPVKIVKEYAKKYYLGGYRSKKTGLVYHHACSQTPTENRRILKDNSNLSTRETQTYEYKTLSIQTYRESGTQMERIDLSIDNRRDISKTAGKYMTADELHLIQKTKTVVIQRYWRGYMARCRADGIRQRNREYQSNLLQEETIRIEKLKNERDEDMKRRLHPSSNMDFEILYNELDAWRKDEIAKIKASTAPGEERKLALSALLADETRALQSIQRLKLNAHREIHVDKTNKMLELMSKPHRWQLSNGDVAFVHTPATKRAQELLELYRSVMMPSVTMEERLNILLQVKWTVQEFNDSLCRDIIDLADREADLLSRGRSSKSLEKLRMRLSNMFLQFIENPEYNPLI